jgi:hypothetical protein
MAGIHAYVCESNTLGPPRQIAAFRKAEALGLGITPDLVALFFCVVVLTHEKNVCESA